MSITSLTFDVGVGEAISIDRGRITVTVEEKSGRRSRLRVMADEKISVEKAGAKKNGVEQAKQGINVK